MSKTILEPAGDHVLVIDVPHDTVIDGITMPDNIKQQEMFFGLVIFAGRKCSDERTKAEAKVCYGPYAGKLVVLDGVQFRILLEGQIEAYVTQVEEGHQA